MKRIRAKQEKYRQSQASRGQLQSTDSQDPSQEPGKHGQNPEPQRIPATHTYCIQACSCCWNLPAPVQVVCHGPHPLVLYCATYIRDVPQDPAPCPVLCVSGMLQDPASSPVPCDVFPSIPAGQKAAWNCPPALVTPLHPSRALRHVTPHGTLSLQEFCVCFCLCHVPLCPR